MSILNQHGFFARFVPVSKRQFTESVDQLNVDLLAAKNGLAAIQGRTTDIQGRTADIQRTLSDLPKLINPPQDQVVHGQLRSLRNCFSAGYSMPQYCVDHGYQKPLFVGDDIDFLCQLRGQFEFDKRLIPDYCSFQASVPLIRSPPFNNVRPLVISKIQQKSFAENSETYDVIFVLNNNRNDRFFQKEKTVYLQALLNEIGNYVYFTRPLVEYQKRHPDVQIILTDIPRLTSSSAETDEEKIVLSRSDVELYHRLKSGDTTTEYLPFEHLGYTREETLRLIEYHATVQLNPDGSTTLRDNKDPFWNISGGFRATAYQDGRDYEHTLWCIGHCFMLGYCAPYDKTFESHLQKLLNDRGEKLRVVNAAQVCFLRYQDKFYNLEKLPVQAGDTILFGVDGIHCSDVFPFFSTQNLFAQPHDFGEVFVDGTHICETGYRVMSEKFYEWLRNTENLCIKAKTPEFVPVHYYGIINDRNRPVGGLSITNSGIYNKELQAFKKRLFALRLRIGSIVMNCNPFTNGHRYLAEYAAAHCAHLYLFVVEEDKSVFPFQDRFELVKQGVSDLSHVTVLPSSTFVLSSVTFEDYLNKANLQEKTVDPSLDIELFAGEIAPALGINIRFAGEEPLDAVTRQYNETIVEEEIQP